MGFGRGKGFTVKAVLWLFKVIIKGGGSSITNTETVDTEVILALGSYP